jgi:branched-chain amino acid transport system substrate-binding protein
MSRFGIERLLLAWALACWCAPVAAQIVIAQVSPQAGYLGFYTRQLAHGAQAAFEAVNMRGGVAGRKIRFITADDGGDPERAVKIYEMLAVKESPVAFLYHVGPDSIVHLLKNGVLDRLQIPLLGTVPAIDSFRTPVRPFVFHLRSGDEPEIAAIIRHLVTIGQTRLSTLYLDDPAGRGSVPIVQQALRAAGGSLAHTAAISPGGGISDETIAHIRADGIQAVLLFMPSETGGSVVAKLRTSGIGVPIYSVSYLDAGTLVATAGRQHARGVAISQAVPNPYRTSLQIVRDYQRDMAALRSPAPNFSPFTLEGYIAARVLIEAVRATGKSAPTGRDVQAALTRMDLEIGGLPLRFKPDTHVGLSFLDIAVVAGDGKLIY